MCFRTWTQTTFPQMPPLRVLIMKPGSAVPTGQGWNGLKVRLEIVGLCGSSGSNPLTAPPHSSPGHGILPHGTILNVRRGPCPHIAFITRPSTDPDGCFLVKLFYSQIAYCTFRLRGAPQNEGPKTKTIWPQRKCLFPLISIKNGTREPTH